MSLLENISDRFNHNPWFLSNSCSFRGGFLKLLLDTPKVIKFLLHKNHREMAGCEWSETAGISPLAPLITRLSKDLQSWQRYGKRCFGNLYGRLFHTYGCLEKAFLMVEEKNPQREEIPTPGHNFFFQCFLLCCHLWGFPSFQFFTAYTTNKNKPNPYSCPSHFSCSTCSSPVLRQEAQN